MNIEPGSTIGIVGGGQLGRMLALAAAPLGLKCHIYAPDEAPPAAQVAETFTRGAFDDVNRLAEFARSVDVVTYEFENIAAAPLLALTEHAPLFPPPRALEIAQDRLAEKTFVQELGGRTAPFCPVASLAELEEALRQIDPPAILKTRRFGYDGKGQARLGSRADLEKAWDRIGHAPAVLEGFVNFDAEFSVILCRGQDGSIASWDSPRNEHEDGILRRSIIPAGEPLQGAIGNAVALARRISDSLGYVGVLAVEFFAVGSEAIFNEMAPRVHNSGHWTTEGARTSQFENHVRAICGLPLGATGLTASRVEMSNLIGDDVRTWRTVLAEADSHLHLYGKRQVRPGRKMGHVTRLYR
jgi:5-(carboxyamino)imidazole ribonucleotide synthase